MKAIVIGIAGSGKTTLVKKLVGDGGLFLDRATLLEPLKKHYLVSSYTHICNQSQPIVIDDVIVDDESALKIILDSNDEVIFTTAMLYCSSPTLEYYDELWVLGIDHRTARFLNIPHRGNLDHGHGFVAKREDDYYWRPFTYHDNVVIGDVLQWKLDETADIATHICSPSL